jgi:HlyD family secretion protein
MPIRRTLIVFAAVAVITPLAFFYLQANAPQGGGPRANNQANFDFFVTETGDVVEVVSAVGTIEADETVDLSFTVSGRIAEVFVKETDYIAEGTLLMRVENDTQRIAYDEAVLNLERQEIDLDELEGPVDADDIRLAEANVDAALGAYRGASFTANPAEIESAQLEIEKAQRDLDAAYERRILGGEFDRQEQVDLADAQIGQASFNLEVARLQLEDLQTGDYAGANAAYLSYLQAQADLETVLAGPTQLELEQAQVRVDQAEARLQSAETDLSKTEIRAPFEGYVSRIDVEPGGLIAPGQAVVQMVDVDPLSVTVEVDEIDIGQIEPGMPANVEIDALSDERLPARLAKVALVGTQTAAGIVNYDAEIELLDVNPLVRVGMTAEANIIVNQRQGVVRVPNAYIRLDRRTNEAFVEVQNPETQDFEEVSVVLGLRGESFSEVTSGLTAGDVIRADLSGNQASLFGD